MEYILWAVKIEDEDWQEQLITSTTDKQHLEKAKTWALANGFNRLRVGTYNGEAPDFTKTLEV